MFVIFGSMIQSILKKISLSGTISIVLSFHPIALLDNLVVEQNIAIGSILFYSETNTESFDQNEK